MHGKFPKLHRGSCQMWGELQLQIKTPYLLRDCPQMLCNSLMSPACPDTELIRKDSSRVGMEPHRVFLYLKAPVPKQFSVLCSTKKSFTISAKGPVRLKVHDVVVELEDCKTTNSLLSSSRKGERQKLAELHRPVIPVAGRQMQEDQLQLHEFEASLGFVRQRCEEKYTVAYYLYEFKIVKYCGKQYGRTSEMWNGIIIGPNSPVHGCWQRKWSQCVEG